MSLFVTGTDTEVGKTIVSALLLARFGRQLRIGYWKPIATGARTDRDHCTVRRLAGAYGSMHEELFLFDPPVSPHLAARWNHTRIDARDVVRQFRTLSRQHPETGFIVEGIGGTMVPVNDDGDLLIDLIRMLRLSCLVVARSTLGTINHTLLTLQALRRHRIPIVGVVLNGPANRDNRQAIERFGKVPIVGQIEPMKPLTARTVKREARRLDHRAILKPHLAHP